MKIGYKKRGKVRKLIVRQPLLCVVLWVTISFGAIQTTNAQQKPNWLINYPADPLYYIGIGGIEKAENDTEYQSKAREIALAELISQIEVNVASSTQTLEKEINGINENSFSQMVQLQAQKTIEDFEVVDSWESRKEYWIYLRLSKQKYNARLSEKIDLALTQAYKAFSDGEKEFEAENYGPALSSYVRSLGDISPYLDRLPEINHQGKQVNLFAELRSAIQESMDKLIIASSTAPERVRIGQAGNQPFSVRVLSKDETPVSGLPFKFEFLRGQGEIEPIATTNTNGVAEARLLKLIADDKIQIISAQLDLSSYLPEESSGDFIVNVLSSFNSISTRFTITAAGTPVYLNYSENFLGEQKTTNYIQPVFMQLLNEENYVFTEQLGDAELYVELVTAARKGSETYGIYSAFVDYKITVTNLVSGQDIATYSITDIKGMSDSYEKAAAKAYETGMDSLKSNLVPRLISQLQK